MNLRSALVSLLLLSVAGHAAAQADLGGTWRAGSLSIRYAVTTWGPDCGPRPPAQTSESGGVVQVAQHGDDLSFTGAVRWTTNTCASETPGLMRVASSYSNGNWTTRCQTPNGHAHPERGVYRLTTAADGSLHYTETTNWNWALRASTCVATRTATRNFTRPTPDVETPPVVAMNEPPEPTPHCTPGPAARISLRPREAALEPGGRQCFRAQVVDDAGCALNDRRVDLQMSPGSEARGRLEARCFVAAATAAEAEGVVELSASSQDLRATAQVRIAPTDLTGLRAQGGSGRSLTGNGTAETQGASGVSARVGDAGVPWLPIAIGAAILVLLLALGIALLLMRRRPTPKHAPEPMFESDEPAHQPPPEPVAAVATTPQENLICPVCRRGYPAGSRFCPNDSELLITYADYRARTEPRGQERICPQCGTRYPAETTFCGKDGSSLGSP